MAANAAAAAWQVPASTVGTVVRMLRAGEDEIAQHYAVGTDGQCSPRHRMPFISINELSQCV